MRILINDHAGHPFQVHLSRKLAARGHDVLHLYCASLQTPHGAIKKTKGDPNSFNVSGVHLSEDFNRYGLISRWRQEKELGKKLCKIANSFSPDVIISANTPLRTQSALLDVSRSLNAKFIYWVQDILGIAIRKNLIKKLSLLGNAIGKYLQFFEYQLLKNSDHIILISGDFKSYIPDKLSTTNKISIIENWAPIDELHRIPKENPWSKKHGLDNQFCFLYSGTLGMKHNPKILLNLALELRSQKNCCVATISEGLGAQYLSEKKKQYKLDNLLLFDFQPYDILPQVLGSANVLVAILEQNSGIFAIPSKVLTYLCAGKPLLLAVPHKNLAARIVSDNETGIVVSPTDEIGFIDAAISLMKDKNLRRYYALNGLEYARNTFEIEKITDKFEAIIHS